MINLLLIAHNFSGAQTYVDELSRYILTIKNLKVFQIYLSIPNSREFNVEEKHGITFITIPEKISNEYNIKYYKRAAQLVFSQFKNLKNTIIHSNMPEQFYFVEELKKLYQCPVVFTFHFLMGYYSSYSNVIETKIKNIEIGNALERFMLEFADHIICVTKFSQHAITKLRNIDTFKTSVIYNGKSLPNKSLKVGNNSKEHYGFSDKDRIILYVGQLEHRKGIDKLIEAFLLINELYPTTKLVIAGEGEYNTYLPLAQKCIARICFTGKLDINTLQDFFYFSDFGVIPSRYEQCSYVLIEMMQCGLPIIISDVPGLNELLVHKRSGLICKTKPNLNFQDGLEVDDIDLSRQMEYYLRHKGSAHKYGLVAKEKAQKTHSLEIMGSQTVEIYNMLLNK